MAVRRSGTLSGATDQLGVALEGRDLSPFAYAFDESTSAIADGSGWGSSEEQRPLRLENSAWVKRRAVREPWTLGAS